MSETGNLVGGHAVQHQSHDVAFERAFAVSRLGVNQICANAIVIVGA
jgi:hypothetical protein